jgi:hypothetical protein
MAISLLVRALVKLWVDCTGCPSLRVPQELGGAYWLFAMLLTPAASFASALYFTECYTGPSTAQRGALFAFVGALAAVWAGALGGFVLAAGADNVHTFVSCETASQYTVRLFRERAGNDEHRAEIFTRNEALWYAIRPEVQAWVEANYTRWKSDLPGWFNKEVIARIPDDVLPQHFPVSMPQDAPAASPECSA